MVKLVSRPTVNRLLIVRVDFSEPKMKICGCCKIKKDNSDFYKNRTKSDGYQTFCKLCNAGSYGSLLKCDICNNEFKVNHRNIKRRKTRLCRRCLLSHSLKKRMEWFDNNSKKMTITTKGYIYVKDGNEIHGYILNHRKVMSEFLKRPLKKSEVVHHIDHDRTNNDISNLWLTDNIGHRVAHISVDLIIPTLVKKGILVFNKDVGEYELKEK